MDRKLAMTACVRLAHGSEETTFWTSSVVHVCAWLDNVLEQLMLPSRDEREGAWASIGCGTGTRRRLGRSVRGSCWTSTRTTEGAATSWMQ